MLKVCLYIALSQIECLPAPEGVSLDTTKNMVATIIDVQERFYADRSVPASIVYDLTTRTVMVEWEPDILFRDKF